MDNIDHIIDILRRVNIFSSLDADLLRIIAGNLKKVFVGDQEIICREGDPGCSMYVVESGVISVIKKGNGPTPVEIARIGAGEVAGIMSLFGDESRSATLRAEGPVSVWEMCDVEFQQLMDSTPSVSRALLNIINGYLRENIRVVADLRSRDIDNRLKIAVFDSKLYTEDAFKRQNGERYSFSFFGFRLTPETVAMAAGFRVICCFVNDIISSAVVKKLKEYGVEMIAMRCAGFNNVDLEACLSYGISVANVPVYSPYAIAEHSVALMMALNRHVNRAYNRVREGNFSLDGLVGFDMYQKTVGIIGAGRIGICAVNILAGFGCRVLLYDRTPVNDPRSNVHDVELDRLLIESDIISLHVPLFPETRHLVNDTTVEKMKQGVMLINTSRGGLIDTHALIGGLLSGRIGSAGLDVYEDEGEYFFEDHSGSIVRDEHLARLTTFPNVIITPHMAFLTKEALLNIADVTLGNIGAYEEGKRGKDVPNSLVRF